VPNRVRLTAGRAALTAIALAAAIALAEAVLAPPRPLRAARLDGPRRITVAGAFHVHTDASPDSSATIDDAIGAAARAGLQFVVATEHGDGTRRPRPAEYRSGVLWIDGVEVSTADGHYATVGMKQAPYPLAGDARDVVEDVARLGGFGVAAHGDSPKSEAQWRDWRVPVDGLEWLNLDSVWRDASPVQLTRAAFTYWFRPAETVASLTSRPSVTLARLDTIGATRHLVALAATDAHGRLMPSYESCFRAFSTRVELERPLTGNAAADAAVVVAALRAGHHFTVLDALAAPGAFEFTASSNGVTVTEGDRLPAGSRPTLAVRVAAPADSTSVLLRNGVVLQESKAAAWEYAADGEPGAYRVEVRVPHAPGTPPVPWILSNPIFVGLPEASGAETQRPSSPIETVPPLWHIEKEASSSGDVQAPTATSVVLRYRLGAGPPANQFVAAGTPAPAALPRAQAIGFNVRASRPLRFFVELRAPGDRRWERSVYADGTAHSVTIPFDEMRPVEPNAASRPDLKSVDAVLIVVAIANTKPGTDGEISVSDFSYRRF